MTSNEVAREIASQMFGRSALIAVMGQRGSRILFGRDGQRWLATVEEIPSDKSDNQR